MAEANTTGSVSYDITYLNLSGIIIGILGVASNVLLLVSFIKDPLKCFRNSGTYLVMNLSVSDCLMCLFLSFFNSTFRISLYGVISFFRRWIGCVSLESITSISIDRFLIVTYPLKHRIFMNGKFIYTRSAAIWTVGSVIPIFRLFLDVLETSGRQILYIFGVIVIIASAWHAFMYLSTYYKLKKQSRNIALQNSTESRAQKIRILKQKRFLQTIIIIVCIAIALTIPYLLLYLLYSYLGFLADNIKAHTISEMLCFLIFYTNFAVNH